MDRSSAPVAERVRSWLPSSPWPIVPGLDGMRRYDRRTQLRPDPIAGLTVAAVAVPAGLGMGELAGLSPVAGLYATLLPLAAYCLFGSSRQLIVGDAILASVSNLGGYRDVAEHPDATSVPGLLVYRFDAPLYFANAAYFTDRLQTLVAAANPKPRWVVLNAEARLPSHPATWLTRELRSGQASMWRAWLSAVWARWSASLSDLLGGRMS